MTEVLNIPNHVAIIVDGNGRWAERKGKKRSEGHKAGSERVKELLGYIYNRGIKCLSLYLFSTENFKRNPEEVSYLMKLLNQYLDELEKECVEKKVRIVFSGREEPLSVDIVQKMRLIETKTENFSDKTVNFCVNYGGHAEIADASKKIAKDVELGHIKTEEINESLFEKYLYHDLPPVDFLIRTSGEERISNFMLWQISYAEFYFPKVLFPDFTEEMFDTAILEYNKRNRKFGENK